MPTSQAGMRNGNHRAHAWVRKRAKHTDEMCAPRTEPGGILPSGLLPDRRFQDVAEGKQREVWGVGVLWVCCAWGLGSRPGGARSSTGKVHTNGPGPCRTRGYLMGTGGQRGREVVAARAELSLAPLWDPLHVRKGPPAGGHCGLDTGWGRLGEAGDSFRFGLCLLHTHLGLCMCVSHTHAHLLPSHPEGHRSYPQRTSILFTKRQGPAEEITLPCTPLSVPRGGHVLFLRTT